MSASGRRAGIRHADDVRLTMRRFRPVQRIDGDDTDRARHAGADLAVVVLLLVAEEHVAMVDLAIDVVAVDGEIDHRDVFFSDQQKHDNRKICPCVSRAIGIVTIDTLYRPEAAHR